MTCEFTVESILEYFKQSPFYLFFSNIPDDGIELVIQSILDCPDAAYFYRKCRGIFCCWVVRELALCLYAFGIEDDGEGGVTVPDINDDPVVSYVKKDEVRDDIREYFKPELPACTDCADFPLGKIKKQAAKYEGMCKGSRRILGGVGTDYGCKKTCAPCEKDDAR